MVRRPSEDEDESFFVSMTDIMVGLLFIFIIIIMYFAVQARIDQEIIQKKNEKIAQQIGIINDLGDGSKFAQLTMYQMQVARQRANILLWIKNYLEFNGVQDIQIIAEQGVIRLPEGVLFASSKFDIEPNSIAEFGVRTLANGLAKVLPCMVLNKRGYPYYGIMQCEESRYHNENNAFVQGVYIEGHTDSDPIGKSGLPGDRNLTTNLKLSARRSTNTFEALSAFQPDILNFYGAVSDTDKLRFEPVLAASAYGEQRPAADNGTREGKKNNRRIDLRVVMYLPVNLEALRLLEKQLETELVPKEDG